MCSASRRFLAISAVTFAVVLSLSTAIPRKAESESEILQMSKLRDLLDKLEEEAAEIPDEIIDRATLRKRWFPVKQYRGGLVAV